MVKDAYGNEVAPGLYEDDIYILYQVFQSEDCLMLRSQSDHLAKLDDFSLNLRRVDPCQTARGLERQITWIQDHFPETIPTTPNSKQTISNRYSHVKAPEIPNDAFEIDPDTGLVNGMGGI